MILDTSQKPAQEGETGTEPDVAVPLVHRRHRQNQAARQAFD